MKKDTKDTTTRQVKNLVKDMMEIIVSGQSVDYTKLHQDVIDAQTNKERVAPKKINRMQFIILKLNSSFTAEQLAKYFGVSRNSINEMADRLGLTDKVIAERIKEIIFAGSILPTKHAQIEASYALLHETEQDIISIDEALFEMSVHREYKGKEVRSAMVEMIKPQTDDYDRWEGITIEDKMKSKRDYFMQLQKLKRAHIETLLKIRTKGLEYFSQQVLIKFTLGLIGKFGGEEAKKKAIIALENYQNPFDHAIKEPSIING